MMILLMVVSTNVTVVEDTSLKEEEDLQNCLYRIKMRVQFVFFIAQRAYHVWQ